MNLKCFMSRISAFFTSLLLMVVFVTESFAATFRPGQVIERFNYTNGITFTAVYSEVESDLVCESGTYLPAGSTTCTTCLAGNWCPGGTFDSNATASDRGINACPGASDATARTTYPERYYAGEGTLSRTSMALVSYKTGLTQKSDCVVNYIWSGARGTFHHDNVKYNSTTGKYDVDTANVASDSSIYYITVNAGYYLSKRYSDTYCNNSGNWMLYLEALPCEGGKYCSGLAAKKCSDGTYEDTRGITGNVAAGYYSTGGAKVQNPQSADDCVGDGNTCGLIAAGYWGVEGANTSTGSGKVNAGYYNMGGGTSATPVMRGNGCVNVSTTQCGTIAPGYYGTAGATQYGGSGTVRPGYYSTGGATSNTPSASDCVGKVAKIEGGKLVGTHDTDNTCGQVKAGYWNNACGTNDTGAVCSSSYEGGMIAAGFWGEAGATDRAGSGTLTPGYYSTGGATVAFPDGNQCVGGNTCGAIAAGYWNNGGGTSATGTCVSGKSCGKVNAGYYSTGGGTSAAPTAAGSGCLANKECGPVDAGYYATGGGTSATPTSAGDGCLEGNSCGPVAAGYWGESGATVSTGSGLCATGYYCPMGSVAATQEECPANYPNSVAGAASIDDCSLTTTAGMYVATSGAGLVTCAQSYYCPGDIVVAYNETGGNKKCQSGFVPNSATGATSCVAADHTISLNLDGGTIGGATPTTCSIDSEDIKLPTPTKTGYTFGGWYQDSAFSGTAISVIVAGSCEKDYNLYAKWTVDTYTVTLDANGGTGGDTSVTATYGEFLPAVNVPSQNGYDFNGYWSAKTGGVQYYDMSGNSIVKWTTDSAGTLYAQWIAKGTCVPGTYYNEDSGNVETCPADSYCTGGTWSGTGNDCAIETCPSDYPNSVAGATEEGQCYKETPKCWCSHDVAECTSKGANSCTYNDVRFQGVTYKSNPDMCVAAPGSSDSTYCEITKVSCKAGTYYTPTGDIEDGSCVSCTTLGDGSFNTSYPSLVKYVSDSNTGATACFKSVDLPCTAPVCPLSNTGTCVYDATHSVLGGGYLFYGTNDPLPGSAEAYVCPGASFTCNTGYDKNDSADIDPSDGFASAPEELCTPHVYTFTLNANGGETAVNAIYEKYNTGWYSDAAATTEIAKVAIPVRQYYTFAGYYTKKTALEGAVQVTDTNGKILNDYKPNVTANTTLYAWWKPNTYTVKYVANLATGSMASVSHTVDTPKTLTPNAFTHRQNDHEFVGWARTASATSPEFEDGQEVVNLTDVNGGEVALYPVWQACTACAAGTGATCTLTAPVGVCTYATACKANYEGLQNAGKYNPACSAIEYTVNLETNGGVISSSYVKVSQCTVESGVITLPTAAQITREDYRFDGWYDNGNFTGSAITSIPAGGCTARKTLYAKWTINVEMCQAGQYYNGTSFVTCPKGYYCPGEGKVTMGVAGCRTECPNGYDDGGTGYSDESQCQISVPQGSYLGTAKNAKTTVCSAGKYTAAATLVAYGETSSCATCEAGNYCTGGTKYSCATETDNVFISSVGSSDDISDCYATTVAGKYIADNTIKTCLVPYYCPGGVKVTYGNSGGNMACSTLSDDVTWESGITASGASTPDKCYVAVEAGKYWDGNKFATCESGTYKTAHQVYYGQTSSCTTCPAGYKSDAGASECYLITTAGKYVATAGKGEVACKAGDFCIGGQKVMASATGGNTACTTLGAGYTSDSGTQSGDMCYKSCATSANATQMTGRDYYGANVADTCAATLCVAGFTVVSGACSVCPVDNVCDPATDNGAPHTCSELTGGVYTKSAAQNGSVDNCYLITTAGKYVATAGKGEVACVADGYCAGGVSVKRNATGGRTTCPENYANADAGASDATQCYTTCSLYSHATQMSGRDYYGTGKDTCVATACEDGFVLANGTCGSCPPNSVCDPNYDGGKPHTCSELTNGKYTQSLENSSSIDACFTVTTAGKYVAVAGQGEVTCKVGDYCLGGVKVMYNGTGGNSACSTFGTGYSSDSGASAETQCYQRCAMGTHATQMSGRDYYGTEATDTCAVASCVAGFTIAGGVCSVCPADNVCDPARDNGTPHTCSELTGGVYTKSAAQNGSVDNCYLITTAGAYVATAAAGLTTCAAGGYCPGGIKVQHATTGGREACPAGYAKSDTGATNAEQCYTGCALVSNAYSMTGRDYYADGTDTCEITLCDMGYTLKGNKCEQCPENNICRPDLEGGKPQMCAAITNGTHEFAAAGSSDMSDCYKKCETYDVVYGTANPLAVTEQYPAQCRFEGKSVTGNPCDIVNGTCVETSCNYNYEMINGKCQACARENALSYKKDGGNCVVESCANGFHPNGQSCEVNTIECDVPNAVSATRVWDATKQAFGECVITECEYGYHLGANTCQADEQVCELEHGIGLREWNHKTNMWGNCIATKCDPGYTNDRSQTNELWKQCGRCNNMYSAGGDLAASSYVDECEIATCMYEGELYTLENNECVLICDTYSDETGSRKWNATRKKCERTCTPGYMPW